MGSGDAISRFAFCHWYAEYYSPRTEKPWTEVRFQSDQHIACLQQDSSSQSDTFVPRELGFQVKALSGEVISPKSGEFSLLFMVNVGRSNEEVSSTYVGGESEVTLENIQNFKSSVQAALAELSHSESVLG